MDATIRKAIERNDFMRVFRWINEQIENLNEAWNKTDHADIEGFLRILIQEVENIKSEFPEQKMNTLYQLGRLDGFVSAYEEVYRAEKRFVFAAEELSQHSAKSMQILHCLYEHGTMRHSDLAEAVNSSNSSLTNIMKKILLSGAVRSARTGKNTLYYLTEIGKRCCKSQPKSELEELKQKLDLLNEKLSKISSAAAANVIPEQSIHAGEQITPILDNNYMPNVKIREIIKIGNSKFVICGISNKESENIKYREKSSMRNYAELIKNGR